MANRRLSLLLLSLIAVSGIAGPWSNAGAEELRDPFTFGPRSGEGVPVLGGILWDASHPMAMVGDREVTIGEVVVGWQVVEIRQDGIVIQRGTEQEVVQPGEVFPP